MLLSPRNTRHDFANFFDHLFDNFMAPQASSSDNASAFFTPRIDLTERDDRYEITAELPGVNKDDINITLDNGVLTLEAECQQQDQEEKDGKIIYQERRYGKFVRRFSLDPQVAESDIEARFEDGILTLSTPKPSEAAEQKKLIQID